MREVHKQGHCWRVNAHVSRRGERGSRGASNPADAAPRQTKQEAVAWLSNEAPGGWSGAPLKAALVGLLCGRKEAPSPEGSRLIKAVSCLAKRLGRAP